MLSLLFALAYWLVLGWAACGALVLCAFVWFLVCDWLDERCWQEDQRRAAELVVSCVPPYDWADPLEQLLLLPDAPNPKWLVG